MSQILQKASEDLYEYCPGNCTRYYIFAKKIEPSKMDSANLAFMWLVRGDRGGQGMILGLDENMDLGYFQQKTEIKNTADAVPLLCFLSEVFGVRMHGVPVEYKKEEWFQKAMTRAGEDLSSEWCR